MPRPTKILAQSSGHRFRRRILLLVGVHHAAFEEAVVRYGRDAGWMLDNTYTRGGRVPLWWQGDGMITLITTPKDYKALKMLPRVPLVDVSLGWISNAMPPRMRRDGLRVPRVLYDNPGIGRLAAEHFLERRFTDIALFNYGNFWMETERIPAFRKAVEEAGATYHEIDYYRHFSLGYRQVCRDERAAHEWLQHELERLPKPLAIFTSNDVIANMLAAVCDSIGLAVPEEVAILGCCDTRVICENAPVSLSSVDINLDGQGTAAARLLDEILAGRPAPREPLVVPPVGVVARESTNVCWGVHAHLNRALLFIGGHFHEPISAEDVAHAAGMSLRGLQEAFRKQLQRTIADEILHQRVAQAKTLLRTTPLKAHEIAEEAGFSGIVHLSQAFLRVTGMRPSEFRRTLPPGGVETGNR